MVNCILIRPVLNLLVFSWKNRIFRVLTVLRGLQKPAWAGMFFRSGFRKRYSGWQDVSWDLKKETMRKIEGIFFDLGDTLLDFGQVDLQGLFRQGAGQAYEYLQQQGWRLPSFSRYRSRHMMAVRWNVLKSTITGWEFNAKDVMGRLCQKMGLSLSEEQLVEVCWRWYEPLRRRATMEAGLPDMLRGFRDAGLELAVVSNTFIPGEVLDRHLAEENLLPLLPVRVYSCDIGRRKPHRSIFDNAIKKIDLAPARIVFVGDSPRADIFGANRMGMISVLKDRCGRHARSTCRASHRIRSILELADIIAEYNGDS